LIPLAYGLVVGSLVEEADVGSTDAWSVSSGDYADSWISNFARGCEGKRVAWEGSGD